MTMLNTTGSTLALGLGGIFGFIRAVAGDLPDPSGVTVYPGGEPRAHLMFGSLDDIRNWGAYLQVPVKAHPVPEYNAVHHRASATWGPVDGKMVTFDMVYVEDVPAPARDVQIPRDCEAVEW